MVCLVSFNMPLNVPFSGASLINEFVVERRLLKFQCNELQCGTSVVIICVARYW